MPSSGDLDRRLADLERSLRDLRRRKGAAHVSTDDPRLSRTELEDLARAIRHYEVDAFVVETDNGPTVLLLPGSESLYRTIVERMPVGAATLDGDGLVVYANPAFAAELTGGSGRVMGRPLAGWCSPKSRKALAAALSAGSPRVELSLAVPPEARPLTLELSRVDGAPPVTIAVVAGTPAPRPPPAAAVSGGR